MRVIDTSLWIEYFSDGALADEAEACIKPMDTCIVPSIVYYELSKWSLRQLSTARTKHVLSVLTECNTFAMTIETAAVAAEISIQHKLHATDSIIYATAQILNAKLYTCDAHFKDLPDVEYFQK